MDLLDFEKNTPRVPYLLGVNPPVENRGMVHSEATDLPTTEDENQDFVVGGDLTGGDDDACFGTSCSASSGSSRQGSREQNGNNKHPHQETRMNPKSSDHGWSWMECSRSNNLVP